MDKDENNITLYVELAKWHIEKNRYIAAAITMIESMLTFCAKDGNNEKIREKLRSKEAGRYSGEHENFIKDYNDLRKLRNKLCHAGDWNKDTDLKNLKQCIEDFFRVYKKKYENKREAQRDLFETVNAFKAN